MMDEKENKLQEWNTPEIIDLDIDETESGMYLTTEASTGHLS
nr:hypothetical protein [uncultured Draconibacterium sp.]